MLNHTSMQRAADSTLQLVMKHIQAGRAVESAPVSADSGIAENFMRLKDCFVKVSAWSFNLLLAHQYLQSFILGIVVCQYAKPELERLFTGLE